MKGNFVHMSSNEIKWALDTTSRGAHALDSQGILLTSKCWKALDFGPALAFFLSILWVTPLSPMFLYTIDTAAAAAAAAKSLQSCLTLCDPIDGSPPGSTVPGIFQARTLAPNSKSLPT